MLAAGSRFLVLAGRQALQTIFPVQLPRLFTDTFSCPPLVHVSWLLSLSSSILFPPVHPRSEGLAGGAADGPLRSPRPAVRNQPSAAEIRL